MVGTEESQMHCHNARQGDNTNFSLFHKVSQPPNQIGENEKVRKDHKSDTYLKLSD